MRILFVANTPPDANKGAPGCDLATIDALRRLGHDVEDLWNAGRPRRFSHGNLHQLLELPRAYITAVERASIGGPFDVVQVNQPHAYLAAKRHRLQNRAGVFINRSHGWEPRVRSMYKLHGGALDRQRPRWRRALSAVLWPLLRRHNELVARYADGVVVCSDDDKEWVVSRHRLDGRRVLALAPGVADAFLQKEPAPMSWERARRLLYVGQYTPVKAPEIVAQVFSAVLRDYPSALATWVCEAAAHSAISAMVDPDIRSRLRLVDWMPRRDLIEVFDSHGVLLLPSHFEGFPLVVPEAQARGLCVVATAVGGARQAISHGATGLLGAVGDVPGITGLVRRAVGDVSLCAAIGAAARAQARGYTWQHAARELVGFYESVRHLKASEQPGRLASGRAPRVE